MDTALKILFLVGYFGVPLYVVGRITWFLTSELKSKMARRLWVASAVCAAAALIIFGFFGDMREVLPRPLYDVLGSFYALSFVLLGVSLFWKFLHWLTGEPMTSLADALGSGEQNKDMHADYLLHKTQMEQFDRFMDDVAPKTIGPDGPGLYIGAYRCDSDLHVDHSSSFDSRW